MAWDGVLTAEQQGLTADDARASLNRILSPSAPVTAPTVGNLALQLDDADAEDHSIQDQRDYDATMAALAKEVKPSTFDEVAHDNALDFPIFAGMPPVVRSVGTTIFKITHALGITGPIEHSLSADAEANIRAVAQASVNVYGNDSIRARLSVAQAVLESGLMGHPSGLAERYLNLFGIKGTGTAGSANMRTREVGPGGDYYINANFAANRTLEDSILQHAHLLERSRYSNVMSATSFAEAAENIQRDGYASDSHYAELLIRIDQRISRYTAGLAPQGPSHPSTLQVASTPGTPRLRA